MTKTFADRVTLEVHGRVAVITLSRPEKMNAFDQPMFDGLNQALEAFRDDDELWVAVIQAAGERAFSAGVDVNALGEAVAKGESLGPCILSMSMVTDKPIIAAVHGYCVGEGVNLALSCDLIMADESAVFMIPEIKLGTSPVDIPVKLARRMGYSQAFAFLNPGDGRDANWARQAGLVDEVFPKGEVQDRALEYAMRIATECGPLAVRTQKYVLWEATYGDPAVAREEGEARRQKIRQSDDFTEGRAAFLEKRPPNFTGR